MSHPVRVRGLKPVGAESVIGRLASHPVRVRGLKLIQVTMSYDSGGWSHPVRVRGLKPIFLYPQVFYSPVAPRAGAWIETSY